MPTFLCFLNWTDQGAKNAKDAAKRYQASKAMAEKLGGRLLSAYVTTGHYDVVITVEMPNGETMTKFVTAIAASGNARTTTVRGYSPEEFSKLVADARDYPFLVVRNDRTQIEERISGEPHRDQHDRANHNCGDD